GAARLRSVFCRPCPGVPAARCPGWPVGLCLFPSLFVWLLVLGRWSLRCPWFPARPSLSFSARRLLRVLFPLLAGLLLVVSLSWPVLLLPSRFPICLPLASGSPLLLRASGPSSPVGSRPDGQSKPRKSERGELGTLPSRVPVSHPYL